MDRMVNNNWLTWILVWMLRTDRTYNSIVEFLKYEFDNKLLGGVTLLKVTLGVIWTQHTHTHTHTQTYTHTLLITGFPV